MTRKTESKCPLCAKDARVWRPNNVPGSRVWETPEETEERKKIACLMRNRPRALTTPERRVVSMLYALEDGTTRASCEHVATALELGAPAVAHEIASAALRKIFYTTKKPKRR